MRGPRSLPDAAAYRAAVLAESTLVGYWPLDEANGTTAKDLKSANNGTYTNGPRLGGEGVAPGGRAPVFDGTNDSVTCANIAALRFAGTVTLTVEAWIKPNGTPTATNRICGQLHATNDGTRAGWQLAILSGGALFFARYSNAAFTAYTAPTPDTAVVSRWTHVAFTFDGSTGIIYANGNPVLTSATGTSITSNTVEPFMIGYTPENNSPFNGLIAHVAVYSSVQSQDKIRQRIRSVL